MGLKENGGRVGRGSTMGLEGLRERGGRVGWGQAKADHTRGLQEAEGNVLVWKEDGGGAWGYGGGAARAWKGGHEKGVGGVRERV